MQPTHPATTPLVKTHVTWGLFTGIAALIVTAALYLLKMEGTFLGRWGTLIVIGVGLLGNAFAFSKANSGAVAFMQIFASGFKATLIITALGVLWAVLSPALFPEMKELAVQATQEALETAGELPENQKQMALNMTRNYFTPILAVGVLLSDLIAGIVFSLIAAAVAPKNRMPQ